MECAAIYARDFALPGGSNGGGGGADDDGTGGGHVHCDCSDGRRDWRVSVKCAAGALFAGRPNSLACATSPQRYRRYRPSFVSGLVRAFACYLSAVADASRTRVWTFVCVVQFDII